MEINVESAGPGSFFVRFGYYGREFCYPDPIDFRISDGRPVLSGNDYVDILLFIERQSMIYNGARQCEIMLKLLGELKGLEE